MLGQVWFHRTFLLLTLDRFLRSILYCERKSKHILAPDEIASNSNTKCYKEKKAWALVNAV